MTSTLSNDLGAKIKSLEGRKDEDLYAIVGAYSLSEEPEQLAVTMAPSRGARMPLKYDTLVAKGREFLKKMNPIFKDAICGKDGIVEQIEKLKVADAIPIILPLLGFAAGAVVPTAILAAIFILLRAGIREYCKGYVKPGTAKA